MDPAVGELQQFVDAYFDGRANLRVLEAGCGSSSYLRLPQGSRLVGIDISEKQLFRNQLIAERILGDLQTFDLPAAAFDMIVCWDVLEHLPHPERAVDRLLRAVNAGGIVVLAMPNVLSVKGQLTKWTPHWFHVWAYRHIFGRKLSGTEDYGPFKTFLKLSIAPTALRRFALERQFSEVFCRLYESTVQQSIRAKTGFDLPPFSVPVVMRVLLPPIPGYC